MSHEHAEPYSVALFSHQWSSDPSVGAMCAACGDSLETLKEENSARIRTVCPKRDFVLAELKLQIAYLDDLASNKAVEVDVYLGARGWQLGLHRQGEKRRVREFEYPVTVRLVWDCIRETYGFEDFPPSAMASP